MTTVRRKSNRKTKAPSQEFRNIKGAKLERLISERKERKMKQADVAEALDVSATTISSIGNRRQKPSLEVSLGLQKIFSLPYEIFFLIIKI